MTSDSPARCIVVGYDGSPASRAALARAAERAGADGRIYIVHAYSLPNDWLGMPNYQSLLDMELDRARALLDRIEHESGADLQGAEYETEVIGDSPARAIAAVAAAREADEIIVGTRGFGRARALLGSVAHELIHLAGCPITVIPERVVDRGAGQEQVGAAS
jgi:nucleotide-binding universal stress UspA family protein